MLNDYKIGSHASNDEWRHYEFARRYPFPIHTKRGVSPDTVVLIVCLLIGAALGLAVAFGFI